MNSATGVLGPLVDTPVKVEAQLLTPASAPLVAVAACTDGYVPGGTSATHVARTNTSHAMEALKVESGKEVHAAKGLAA